MSGHWRKPVDFTDEALESARTQLAGFREALALPERGLDGRLGAARGRARGRLQHAGGARRCCTTGRRAGRATSSRAGSTSSGIETRVRGARRRSRQLRARAGGGARRRRTGRAADAARGEIEAARLGGDRPSGRHCDLAHGRDAMPPSSSTGGGRCARRCAAAARCSSCSPPSGPRATDWERKPKIVPEKTLTELAGTRDHQGVVARVEPFRYADAYELAAGEPLLVALDQVTDPRNLGAVIRSAEGAGATGVILPAHNSARVTPAVARSSAGAVEHLPVAVVTEPGALPERGEGAAALGLRRRRGRNAHVRGGPVRGADPRVRRGGEGDPAARPASRATRPSSIPLAGQVESLNVCVAAAVLLYEARRQREPCLTHALPLRRLQPAPRRRLRRCARARRPARELRRRRPGARGIVVFDGHGRGPRARAARRCATRRTPTRCSSGSRPSTATGEQVCLVSSDSPCAGTSGVEVRKLSSKDVRARPRLDASTRSSRRSGSRERLDEETRAKLERLRRGQED